jgi:hypothetical protein
MVQSEILFPLTPTHSLGERVNARNAGKFLLPSMYFQADQIASLPLRERARVRGNRASDFMDTARGCAPLKPPERLML